MIAKVFLLAISNASIMLKMKQIEEFLVLLDKIDDKIGSLILGNNSLNLELTRFLG